MLGSWHDRQSRRDRRRYLMFMVGDEPCGVAVHQVREVVPVGSLTARSAETGFACGVLDPSKEKIPVVDLRARLGLREDEVSPRPLMIIVRVGGTVVGLLADRLTGVVSIRQSELAPSVLLGSDQGDGLFRQVRRAGEDISLIPDIETIIGWMAPPREPAFKVRIPAV